MPILRRLLLLSLLTGCVAEPPRKTTFVSGAETNWEERPAATRERKRQDDSEDPAEIPQAVPVAEASRLKADDSGRPRSPSPPKPSKMKKVLPGPALAKPASGESPRKPAPSDPKPTEGEPKKASANIRQADRHGLIRSGPGSGYLSPGGPKRVAVQDAVPDASEEDTAADLKGISADEEVPEIGINAISVETLREEFPDSVPADPNEEGSYRVQVSVREDFASFLLDKIYPFLEETDARADMLRATGARRAVWVRVAFIDLLDFQHPYSKPKKYRLRRPRPVP